MSNSPLKTEACSVILAQVGIQLQTWIPACAGMTQP